MPYPRGPRGYNETEKVPEEGSFITGKKDAIYLRNKYQTELDNANKAIVDTVHYLEDEYGKLKYHYNAAQGLKRDIDAHQSERATLFDSLNNLLNKETNFESEMWKTTQQGMKVDSVIIKQKFKDSDIDEMRYDSMKKYIEKYPEYVSKSSFRKILDDIETKEKAIRYAKQNYTKTVSDYNYLLSVTGKLIQKAEDKFVAYDQVLSEGNQRLAECRYNKSVWYKLASEKTRDEVKLSTLRHRVAQFKNTLEIIKKEFLQYEGKNLVEMEY